MAIDIPSQANAALQISSAAGLGGSAVTIITWGAGLMHVDIPNTVAVAFVTLGAAVIGFFVHRFMSRPKAPAVSDAIPAAPAAPVPADGRPTPPLPSQPFPKP